MAKKIVLLGSGGMLGQAAIRYFSKNYEVVTYNKRYSIRDRENFIFELSSLNPDVIINCIGKIKQKTSEFESLFTSNALLPLDLNAEFRSALIIHPSTDCVFSGEDGRAYSLNDSLNAKDDYGISKIFGELAGKHNKNTYVLRTSIIGLTENYISQGLLDWFMRQDDGSTINGYTNHLWNGITTLEWCILAEKILNGSPLGVTSKVIQVGASDVMSKYELLILANKVFQRNTLITPTSNKNNISRVLIPELKVKSIKDQLLQYWNWLND